MEQLHYPFTRKQLQNYLWVLAHMMEFDKEELENDILMQTDGLTTTLMMMALKSPYRFPIENFEGIDHKGKRIIAKILIKYRIFGEEIPYKPFTREEWREEWLKRWEDKKPQTQKKVKKKSPFTNALDRKKSPFHSCNYR